MECILQSINFGFSFTMFKTTYVSFSLHIPSLGCYFEAIILNNVFCGIMKKKLRFFFLEVNSVNGKNERRIR